MLGNALKMAVRGGDINVGADGTRTSMRTERPPYEAASSAAVLPTLGMRLALGLPAIVDDTAVAAIRESWEKEGAQQDDPTGPADARQLAQQLEENTVNTAQRRALATLRTAVEAERAGRAEAN
jgi:hypothetical protein